MKMDADRAEGNIVTYLPERGARANRPSGERFEFCFKPLAGVGARTAESGRKIPEVAEESLVEAAHEGDSSAPPDDGCSEVMGFGGSPGLR